MQIDWDVPIEMDDGVVLRADVYRPAEQGKFPVILSYGPYAKGLSFQEGYKGNWARLTKAAPEVLQNSSNKYQNWELIDPEKWVPDGYVLVRVNSRGAGRSPGHLDVWSAREAQDLYECVEWAGTQDWSNGKVGINGISYYAMNQWQVGALQAAASGRTVHLGRLVRLLPRALSPRRHPERFSQQLASAPGRERAARRRRPRRQKHCDRRAGRRPANAVQGRTRQEPRRHAGRGQATCSVRRLLRRAHARLRSRSMRRCCRPAIGAAWACTRAAISKAICAPAPSRNGWRCTATRISRISTAITARRCRRNSSATSSKARTPAGTSSRASRSISAIRARNSCCAPRTNGRSSARNGPNISCSRTAASAPTCPRPRQS